MIPLSFEVNCTLPPNITHYVSGANTRGTLDIVWSSLTILVLCVWSIQHLDLPPQWHPSDDYYAANGKSSRRMRRENMIKRKGMLLRRELRWMGINLFVPEFLMAKALQDFISVREMHQCLKPLARDDGVDWSVAHTYYANMGGFVIRFNEENELSEAIVDGDDDLERGQRSSSEVPVPKATMSIASGNEQDEPSCPTEAINTEDERRLQTQVDGSAESIYDHDPNQHSGNTHIRSGESASQSPPFRESEKQSHKHSMLSSGQDGQRVQAAVSAAITEDIVTNGDYITIDAIAVRTEKQNVPADTGKRIASHTNQPPTRQTTVDQNMQTIIYSLLESKTWGAVRYLERVRDFQSYNPVDWDIDMQNQETVFKAFREYGTPDMRNVVLLTWYNNVSALQGNVWYVDAAQLLLAREVGIIASLPNFPDELLDDQSKSSFIVKAVTLTQVIWLVLQLIVRQTEGLPAAQLEVVVLAFAACSLFTCLLLWNKPQGVEACCYVTACRRPSSQEVKALGVVGPIPAFINRLYPWMSNHLLHTHSRSSKWSRPFVVGMLAAATLFGGLHCLSWNSHFPTPAERLLWRISCLYLTIGPSVAVAIRALWKVQRARLLQTGKMQSPGYLRNFIVHAMLWPYLLIRLYLTVEMLRALAYLPPEVFQATNWPNYLPHWM